MAARHILLIDDSQSVRYSLTAILNQLGFNCFEAENGKEALKKLEDLQKHNMKPELIMVDINMPVMNGFEFIVAFRKINRLTPILILTSLSDKEKIKAGKKAGANGWAVKPIGEKNLTKALKKLISL